jgi:hypothetical protein
VTPAYDSAAGGYSLVPTASDHRIRAVGTVSGADIAHHFRLPSTSARS